MCVCVVCVCVCVCVYVCKMSSAKKLAWRFKSSNIHCSHNVYTGDYIIGLPSYLLIEAVNP